VKLGIVVVYLVGAENGALLDLHLGQIEKHTRLPYTIYGSVNRLQPEFRRRLERQARVKICDCPTTDLRSFEEHSHYLEYLTKFAIEDGASHIVTLHVDSFPVRPGWEEELALTLTGSCAFTTIERINTACLFFHRDFYLKYAPSFLPSKSQKERRSFKKFLRTYSAVSHSGSGFGLAAFENGLLWRALPRTTPLAAFGRIYGDMVFHLGRTVWIGDCRPAKRSAPAGSSYHHILELVMGALRTIVPARFRPAFRRPLKVFMDRFVDEPRLAYQQEQLESVRQALLRDPEGFLRDLRPGRV
jgi:hypothetical protein